MPRIRPSAYMRSQPPRRFSPPKPLDLTGCAFTTQASRRWMVLCRTQARRMEVSRRQNRPLSESEAFDSGRTGDRAPFPQPGQECRGRTSLPSRPPKRRPFSRRRIQTNTATTSDGPCSTTETKLATTTSGTSHGTRHFSACGLRHQAPGDIDRASDVGTGGKGWYLNAESAPKDYARLQKAAFDPIRKINPKTQVVGMGTHTHKGKRRGFRISGDIWSQRMATAGGMETPRYRRLPSIQHLRSHRPRKRLLEQGDPMDLRSPWVAWQGSKNRGTWPG